MKELKQNDINNIIEILEEAKKDNLIVDQNHKLYDFKDQYCVITESVKIDQYQEEEIETDCMYFPNNVLTFENNKYKIIRIYKKSEDAYMCDYEYTEDYKQKMVEKLNKIAIKLLKLNKIFTANFETLFKDYEEISIKCELINELKNINLKLKLLKSCKRQTTKSGADFKILNKNIVSDLTKYVNIIENYSYKDNLNTLKLEINNVTFISENIKNIDDIFNVLIPENIKTYEKNIIELNKKIKNLHQVYKKIKALKTECREVAEKNGFNLYYFNNMNY